MTDERLREIAKKHARQACAPINALCPASMQEQIRCEEVIFYALKDACAVTEVEYTPTKWDGIERRDPLRNLRSDEE